MEFTCGSASIVLPLGILLDKNLPPTLTGSWEFVTTMNYDWSVIRGHRPYRWTIWVSDDKLYFSFPQEVRI
jgi:hypothetical protein